MTKVGCMANSDAYLPKVENSDLKIDWGNCKKSQIRKLKKRAALPEFSQLSSTTISVISD